MSQNMAHDEVAALGRRLQQVEGDLAMALKALFQLLIELTERSVIASDWLEALSPSERDAVEKKATRVTAQASNNTPHLGGIKTWN